MSENNPYSAPKGLIVADSEIRKGSPLKAILLGLLVDIGGTFVLSFVLVFVYGMVLLKTGLSPQEIATRMNLSPTSGLGIVGEVLGLGLSLLGGYVCARIVKEREYKWAAIMALISSALGLWMSVHQMSWVLDVFLTALTLLAVMSGAALGKKKNARLLAQANT